jgi:hypothetical protein
VSLGVVRDEDRMYLGNLIPGPKEYFDPEGRIKCPNVITEVDHGD